MGDFPAGVLERLAFREVRSSAVLLLLIWMKMRRPRGVAASNAMLPSGPDMLRWPMRRPVLLPRPAVIISSSRHSVPSKKSGAEPSMRRRISAVIAPQPGMK